ncbi:hypothetical protein HX864_05000 [Pseudomonas yamanorum]|uniref:hypothetical protein n=1 Tax=Pseudomonas yamanorum TaxID=515393 RepID=UPI0015A05EB5|nr:hypothetical protein [Pseudomonas yamanorum]NWD22615.1 hypothetical protein [Pseudomonas yamanorum]
MERGLTLSPKISYLLYKLSAYKPSNGKFQEMKSKAKICKSCKVINSSSLVNIKNGRCYTCRKIAHEKIPDNKISFLVPVTLVAISLYFLMLSINSIYFQHAIIFYRGRGFSASYEFTGMAIILPSLSFIVTFIGSFALALACCDKRREKITYIKVIAGSLLSCFVFQTVAIFFGERIS